MTRGPGAAGSAGSATAWESPSSGGTRAADAPHRGRARRGAAGGLPRLLPWDSAMTRLWPGTKIVCLAALSTALLLWPTWSAVASIGAVLLVGSLVARVPPSALPRVPMILWSGVAGGLMGAWLGGGLWILVRSLLVATVVVWGSSLLVWTTPLERMVPALRVLLTPLGWLRVPVDEWVTTMGFVLRGLPEMRDQTSAVVDAAKLRSGGSPPAGWRAAMRLAVDVTTASLSAASRRASDTGRAMTLRGGVPGVRREPVRLGWPDLVAAVATAVAIVALLVFRHGWEAGVVLLGGIL